MFRESPVHLAPKLTLKTWKAAGNLKIEKILNDGLMTLHRDEWGQILPLKS